MVNCVAGMPATVGTGHSFTGRSGPAAYKFNTGYTVNPKLNRDNNVYQSKGTGRIPGPDSFTPAGSFFFSNSARAAANTDGTGIPQQSPHPTSF